MAIKYTKTKNIPTASIARPSQIYPNLDFWFENVVSYYLATLHPMRIALTRKNRAKATIDTSQSSELEFLRLFNCNAPTAFSGTKFVMPT
jgi:hypothetical protein